MAEIKVFVCVNEDGDYVVAKEDDDIADNMANEYGGIAQKLIEITIRVTPPARAIQLMATIPDDKPATMTVQS